MNATRGNRVLFVDDEPCMREIMIMLLSEEGYEVSTALDGLDALAQLRNLTPALIISDLHMPRMSGLEFLSVVRRRFPSIPVIAVSGAFERNEIGTAGVMADAFYPKARCNPDELMRTVANLIQAPVARATNYRPCNPPAVQMVRRVTDVNGQDSFMLTCADCLRAFSLPAVAEMQGVQEANCAFCTASVQFRAELSRRATSHMMLNACGAGTPPPAL